MGGVAVTVSGVCWSINQNSTIAGSKTTDGTGAGSFTSNITGLIANTTYYVRAYATNSVGTAYGNEISFTTAGTTVTDSHGVCPTGWHVPSDAEWTKFTALPGGYRYFNGAFGFIGEHGYWWSSSGYGQFGPIFRFMTYSGWSSNMVSSSSTNVPNGYSVRCVRD